MASGEQGKRRRRKSLAARFLVATSPLRRTSAASSTDLLLDRTGAVTGGVGVVRGDGGGPSWANDAFLQMSGFDIETLQTIGWAELAGGDVSFPGDPVADGSGTDTTFDREFVRRDGSRWPVIISRGVDPADPEQLILFVVDLTGARLQARKLAESELAEARSRLAQALHGAGIGVWEWDVGTDLVKVSGSALGVFGFDGGNDTYGEIDYRAAIHSDDQPALFDAIRACIDGRSETFEVEVRLKRRGGGWIWTLDRGAATMRDDSGRAIRMVGTLANIDDSKRAVEQLRWTVDHDPLTGLANRSLFHSRLEAALAEGGKLALVLLDVDEFKIVNDLLGHAAGDGLLTVLAERLRDFAYPHETVARLGGDEFTILIPDFGDPGQLLARLESLGAALARPFEQDGQTLTCRSSIGVALTLDAAADASTLLRNADIAMYSVKNNRRGGVAMYEPVLGDRLREEAETLLSIREALDADRIAPCYEPIVRLADGRIAGLEALPRIVGDDDSAIDMHAIEGAFADFELSIRLGDCMIDRVLRDFAEWRRAGIAPEFVSINVGLAQLRRPVFASRLLEQLSQNGVPPGEVRVEIVETGLHDWRSADVTQATLAELSAGGVLAGLDNFGASAASLAHLATLPLAAVKIDRQFMQGVTEPGSDQAIVRAITGLGVGFGLRVAAMGVDTAAQAVVLTEIGCTYGQGAYFGLPQDAEDIAAVLQTRARSA